jgi:hypothetical protein
MPQGLFCPEARTSGWQMPPVHAPPWQLFPQLAQFFPSTCSSTHAPSHEVKPAPQLSAQAPLLHAAEPLPLVGAGHDFPQPPQFKVSLEKLTQALGHAFGLLLVHAKPHDPCAHVVTAPTTVVAQTCPHEAQFCGSLDVSTHVDVDAQRVGVATGQPETQP